MPFQLSKSYPRLWSLDTGMAMVVTDLHGDWEMFARYRDRFIELHDTGRADFLIFTGDLIHREPGAGPDRSLDIVLDLVSMRERYGDAVICLCGNHELPHLYGFVLGKGAVEYTSPFEAALSRSGRRADVVQLLDSLPFFLRTAAGVCLTHAGAFPQMDAAQAARLFNWSHQALRDWADAQLDAADRDELRSGYARLSGAASYDEMARHYLAVAGPDDLRYDDLLRGFMVTAQPDFRTLRAALFTRCEQEQGEAAYAERLDAVLIHLSAGYVPQRVLVAGHMATDGGHAVIAGQHLRIASGAHAQPQTAAQYLLFDTARSADNAEDARLHLHSVI
jgi:hypothetical protein